MTSSLVGSEMCIRDRRLDAYGREDPPRWCECRWHRCREDGTVCHLSGCPVSYTHLTLPTICSV
eukprot:1313511-Prorocentrum_lima.AAC.1